MSETVYIIGHKNPDTDSICSAIAFAKLKEKIGEKAIAVCAGQPNTETQFALQKFQITQPDLLKDVSGKTLILVDHNEKQQSPEGISQAEIIEILDHHKVSFSYAKPITISTKPLGSTCTLVCEKYQELNVDIEKNIAGILLCGILSDTIILQGPTTTAKDKEMAEKLAFIAGIKDLESFGIELKKQKASLKGKTALELIKSDLKEFKFHDRKSAIGQIEVIEDTEFNSRRIEFTKTLEDLRNKMQLDLLLFMVTNIMNKGTELLVSGDTKLVEDKLKKTTHNGSLYIEGMMSRKKDLVPVLER